MPQPIMPHSRATDQGSSQPTGGFFSTLLGRFAVSGDTGNHCVAQEVGSPYPFKPISPQTHLTENPAERATSQKRLSIQGKYAAYSQAKALQEDSTLRAVAFGSKTTGIACGDRGTILRSVDGGHSWKLVDHDHQYSFTDIAWLSPQRAIMVEAYSIVSRVSVAEWSSGRRMPDSVGKKPWIPNYPCYGA